MRHAIRAGLAGCAVTIALGFAATAAQAQDPAGCYSDFAMLSRDEFFSGRPVPTYCPYGYGPGMPYAAAPRAGGVARQDYAPRPAKRHRTASRPSRRVLAE